MPGGAQSSTMPGPAQVQTRDDDLNLAESLDVGSRIELMINKVWYKARIESRCEEPMQIDGDDDEPEMELKT